MVRSESSMQQNISRKMSNISISLGGLLEFIITQSLIVSKNMMHIKSNVIPFLLSYYIIIN